jgi:predicted nucleotidyltransferase
MELDYQAFFKQLNNQKIDYLIVGELAVNLHGIPRMTYDIDLMVHLDAGNIKKLVEQLKGWGYVSRAPVQPEKLADEETRGTWIHEKNMRAFSFYSDTQPLGEIDLVIDVPIEYEELKRRANVFDLEGVQVPVISIRDLIELKLKAGRKQDLSDVENLNMILER